MNREQVKYIANIHYRKLKKYIDHIIPGYEAETIHQFRVEYKKLRAFLRMISYEKDNKGAIKISKKLKKLYNISGSIRDLQLQFLRITEAVKQESGDATAYLRLLYKKNEKSLPVFSKALLDDPVAASKKKTTSSIHAAFSLNKFKDYLQRKMTGIREILDTGIFNDDDIHSIRKSLKDIFYNMEIFERVENGQLYPYIWSEDEKKYLNEFLHELGDFQDKCTAITLLSSHLLKDLNISEQELLERIKEIWLKEKLILKQSLTNKLQTRLAPLLAMP